MPVDTSRSSKYYDAISAGYDTLYGDEQRVKYGLLRDWLGFLQGSVLDVGSGTGIINEFIQPFVLSDYSFGMIRQVKLLPGQFRLVCDARFLPFKSKSFNNASCFTVLQDIPEKYLVVKELARVCIDLVVITVLKRLIERKGVEDLFRDAFEVVDYREEEKDHCFLLRVKEPVKAGKVRFPTRKVRVSMT